MEQSIWWMTARSTSSRPRCDLLLLPFLIDRRKPDYSGAVDDVAVRIEARSVTWAIPTFLGVVPAYDAIEMRADRRMLVDSATVVAVHRDLSATATHDCTFSRFERFYVGNLAGREIILELLGDVRVFPDVLRRRTELHARRIIEASPLVL